MCEVQAPPSCGAKDLYDSPLWRKRRRYAEATGMPWAILSAEHGMIHPDEMLEPYDRYLGNESVAFRRRWAAKTAEQVLQRLEALGMAAAEIHAGSAYVNSGLKTQRASSRQARLSPRLGVGPPGARSCRASDVEARITRMADSIQQQQVAASEEEQRIHALKRAIEQQDGGLDKFHRHAAGLGIDVSLKLDHHRPPDDGGPFPA